MKRLYLYLTLSAVMILSFGMANAQSSAKADKILESAKAKFRKQSDISASLVYTLSNPNMSKPITKRGTVKLKGKKYAVMFADEEIYCNGREIVIILKQDEEVTISDYDEDESPGVDRVFNMGKDEYKSRYDGEVDGQHKITLFSNSKDGDIFKVEVWINASTNMLERSMMYARNGSTYSYTLSNISTNTGVSDGFFTKSISDLEDDGYYVTDMRED